MYPSRAHDVVWWPCAGIQPRKVEFSIPLRPTWFALLPVGVLDAGSATAFFQPAS
jgi:hypothetical protein